MDITTLTTEQLKALAYDCFVQLETTQKNLKIINEEISKRNANTANANQPTEGTATPTDTGAKLTSTGEGAAVVSE